MKHSATKSRGGRLAKTYPTGFFHVGHRRKCRPRKKGKFYLFRSLSDLHLLSSVVALRVLQALMMQTRARLLGGPCRRRALNRVEIVLTDNGIHLCRPVLART